MKENALPFFPFVRRIHTSLLLASLCLLLISSCKEEAPPEGPTEETKPNPDSSTSAEAVVEKAFQAERVQRDIKAYLALWGIDCALSHGKGSKASNEESPPLDCKQMEAWTRVDMTRPEIVDAEFTHENMQSEKKGHATIVNLDLVMTKGGKTVKTRERFKLTRQDGVLKITDKRSWPLESNDGKTTTQHNEEYWAALDQKVAELTSNDEGGSPALVDALLSSYQFNAAYAEANRAIEDGKEMTLEDWLQFAKVSFNCGHMDTAVRAYRKVRELDSEQALPSGAFY